MILSGDPDSLSDEDLLNHRLENRIKKGIKYFSVLGLPLLYYFYYQRNIRYSLGIGLLSYIAVKNFTNFINFTKCDYSFKFAVKTYGNAILDYNRFNGFYEVSPASFWELDTLQRYEKCYTNPDDIPSTKKNISNRQPI